MAVDKLKAMEWYKSKQGKVTYSMERRDGPNSYDCSSFVYYGLIQGGAESAGWAVNTEYMHAWLKKNGAKLIAENTYWDAEPMDIVIHGELGKSAGAGGHVMVMLDDKLAIHCNYGRNGVTIDDHDKVWEWSGQPYFYVYRFPKGEKYKKLGWVKDDKGYKFIKPDGLPMQKEWKEWQDKWYYLKDNTYMATSEWIKSPKGEWYYVREDGSMIEDDVVKIGEKYYVFDKDGKLVQEMKRY